MSRRRRGRRQSAAEIQDRADAGAAVESYGQTPADWRRVWGVTP